MSWYYESIQRLTYILDYANPNPRCHQSINTFLMLKCSRTMQSHQNVKCDLISPGPQSTFQSCRRLLGVHRSRSHCIGPVPLPLPLPLLPSRGFLGRSLLLLVVSPLLLSLWFSLICEGRRSDNPGNVPGT